MVAVFVFIDNQYTQFFEEMQELFIAVLLLLACLGWHLKEDIF